MIARVIATWFYLGYAPKAPGTFGTLGAIAVALLLVRFAGFTPWSLGVLGVVSLLPAIWASDVTAKAAGLKDPQIVVVDEVVGTWITLAGAARLNWQSWVLAFALFRIFDIWKPWPVRKLEAVPGGAGIVLDDAMAGVYGALVLYALGWFNLY